VILLLVAAVIFSASFRNGPPARLSVAVLPFRDVSSHRELGYLADGFRDGLISTLVQTKGLEITARLSSGQVVDQGQGLAALARSVHADAVVSGSVTSSGGAAQVAVFLVDAKTGHYLWSQTYPAAVADLAIAEHSAASENRAHAGGRDGGAGAQPAAKRRGG
jgi:TolB-like protein